MPPVKPMLAKAGPLETALAMVESGKGQIEPKWD